MQPQPETGEQHERSPSRLTKLATWGRAALSAVSRNLKRDAWGLSAAASCAGVYLLVLVARGLSRPGRVDDFYIYLFARSIAFDFDIDFTNDYAVCGDPGHHGRDFGAGRPGNYWYSGPAFVLAPLLAIARIVMPLGAQASAAVRAGCTGPYLNFVLVMVPLLGGLAVYLSYRAARRFADDLESGVAAALIGFGTPIIAYASVFPLFTHVYSALFVAAIAVASFRAFEKPEAISRWALAGLLLIPTVLTRPPQAVYGLLPAVLALASFRKVSRTRFIIALAAIALGGLLAVGAQLLQYKYLFGGYLVNPHGRHYMQLGHSHPWLLLFGVKGGFFYHAPVAWLSLIGVVVLWKRGLAAWLYVGPAIVAAAVEVYVYSGSLGWHSYGTFGARKLTSLTALLTVTLAAAVGAARHYLARRPGRLEAALAGAVVIPMAFTYAGAAYAFKTGRIKTDVSSSLAGFFGEGVKQAWTAIDNTAGPLSVLPAALVFSARYRLAPSAFRAATDPNHWYVRSFRSRGMRFLKRSLPLGDERLARTIRGGELSSAGLRLQPGQRGHVVFTAEWPVATSLTLRGDGGPGCRVWVGRGGWFSDTWYGEVALPEKGRALVAVPEGGFDSGINELLFEVLGEKCPSVLLRKVELEDKNVYETPYESQETTGAEPDAKVPDAE